jgi:hypothetical protein
MADTVQFVHVVCWCCNGRRYVARDTSTERDEPCGVCCAKGTIVEEVKQEDATC